MRMRYKLPIVTLVGVGVLLLSSLAVIFAPRAQTVYAQDPPQLFVSMGELSLPQGGSTYVAASAHNLPRDLHNQDQIVELTYRKDLFRVLSGGSTENANGCANGMGGNTPVDRVYANPKIIGGGSEDNFTIKSDCPTGSYRVRMSVRLKDANTDLVFGTKDFTVIPGPSVTIALSSASFYRGTSSNVTITFNHLPAGANLSYRTYVMQLRPTNYAESCEGAGLGAQVAMNSVATTEVRNGTIAAACPTGEYELFVVLYNSSNGELTSTSIEFVVSTDPGATPSMTIELSSRSVTPGTAIEATITVYDLQDGANLEYRTDVIKRVDNADVVESDCHDGEFGLGQEFGFTVGRNPFILSETISSNCPAGSYKLKSVISDGSGNEIVSGSADFTVGVIEANRAPVVTISTASASLEGGAMLVISGKATDPDSDSVEVSASTTGGALSAVTRSGDDWSVTLTAPAVTANTQTITVTISGEDPAGLTATASRAWTVGANVDPTVTIDQADMTVDGGASVDLSAVVAAPEAGQSVSTLWTATGGSYPDGDSETTVRWVAPAGGQTDTGYTLTATVEDALGATASDSIEVTVREDPNLTLIAPTVLNQNGRVGTPYTQTLDAWTGGVAPLKYTVTGQPDGLSFNEGTRTITGIPIAPVISVVTYTVTDNDGNGDEASTTFTITVIEANRVPVVTISTASARLEGGATQVISGEATDPEGDSVEVSASTTGGALSAVTRSGNDWSVTLTAPAVTADTQTITVTISGEDPAGLTATASRAWTVGANVDPTVTIDQTGMTVDGGASVYLSAVVAAPEAGQSVSTLWTATGGSYPDGDSGTTVRWVAPAGGQTDTGYTLTATATDALGATASDSIDFTVVAGPSVTIALSSASFYRGTSSDVTMEFSYLNNVQDGSDLSYRADIMRIISENSLDFADKCEGAGLGNIDKSDDSDSHLSNPGDSPSGAIEDQDRDGAVEVSGQIPTTCPTGRYKLTVELWDSSNSELTSTSIEFVVSTDPNATPSATVELSPPSPVTPGTAIEATITVYDLQDGANLEYRTDVIERVDNADVVASSCHDGEVGLGQEFGFTVGRNPFILSETISSNCPAGSYKLKSVISDGSGNEIVSGSADFTVGVIEANRAPVVTISTASARLEGGAMLVISGEATDPDSDSVEVNASTTGGALSAVTRSGNDWSVTLTAPAVTADTQTITVTISGEDPAGLTATASRAWTVGANVAPTVTIDQTDMTVDGGASVYLSAVVAAPEAGQSVSTLWTATGGSYPAGASGTTVRWVAPASGQTDTGYTLTATVEDALGATASDSIDFTVVAGPSVTIALSSASFYRGTSSDVTMEFSYLNNVQDGSDLSYRADIMRIISENSLDFADKCEGAGLGNIDKSDDSDSHLSNPGDSPSGAIEGQDGDGAVEVSGQIPTTCPTGRYKLTVELWDSSNSELTSTSIEFVVSTDPNATPSATVELSPPSPVTPGTAIEATITVYDLQDGANLEFRTDVIKRVDNADVVESDCHGGEFGLGQEFGFTVGRNPFILSETINCPAGSYKLKSVISDGSGNEIVSGAVNFEITNSPQRRPSQPPGGNSNNVRQLR